MLFFSYCIWQKFVKECDLWKGQPYTIMSPSPLEILASHDLNQQLCFCDKKHLKPVKCTVRKQPKWGQSTTTLYNSFSMNSLG